MRVLVFSDTHLTSQFDQKKYIFLERLIRSCDRTVVNGDFYDGYITNYEDFINSDWKKLLELLSSRDTIYIIGNHDKKGKFKGAVRSYSLKLGGVTYKIEHGDRLDKLSVFDHFGHNKILGLVYVVLKNFERLGIRKWGKDFLNTIYLGYNERMKKEVLKEARNGEIYVCAHSHISEIDLKNKFINTGMIDCGLGQYVVLDTSGPQLFEEKY